VCGFGHLSNYVNNYGRDLEKPHYAFLNNNRRIFIPSGWAHATYTLDTCAVPSMVFAAANSLGTALKIRKRAKDSGKNHHDCVSAIVESMWAAFIGHDVKAQEMAFGKFEKWKKALEEDFKGCCRYGRQRERKSKGQAEEASARGACLSTCLWVMAACKEEGKG